MSGGPSSTIRTRKNVLTLGNPGDDLDWYSQAIAALQNRALTDPTSWRYLSAVHGYSLALDPNPTNVPFPSNADQRKFWNQCQHQSWYFLPRHRAYLVSFEQIVADAVVKLGGSGLGLALLELQRPQQQQPSPVAACSFRRCHALEQLA
jgi:Common central domain of tyrosinase